MYTVAELEVFLENPEAWEEAMERTQARVGEKESLGRIQKMMIKNAIEEELAKRARDECVTP